MSLRLYDTMARSVREFTPKTAGMVGVYLCGATVQSQPHIGHMRSGVSYDVLRRWLTHAGHAVTFVRNVTDIDDKVLAKSVEQNLPWWALAYANERAFDAGYSALGCLAPTYAPRATGHVPEMIELMDQLIGSGHAYTGGDDVFFAVRSFAKYGALSHRQLDDMRAAEDADVTYKRDPRDFALWKGAKVTEPESASWHTPWGRGRPGWHLECSAMAGKYLGEEFDIHGGGPELIFPHHENEIAQSQAAGRPFARYWVHHALVNMGGEKMAKSVGNVVSLPAILSQFRAVEVRYYLAGSHYRSVIDYTPEALSDAATAYRRLENFVQRATQRVGSESRVVTQGVRLPAEFSQAMDDDLATPRALSVVHETVRSGNQALSDGNDAVAAEAVLGVRAMLNVLGLDPLNEQWHQTPLGLAAAGQAMDTLVAFVLQQREVARQRKDYAASDAIRDQLVAAGVTLEDTASGTRWSLS